MSFLQIKNYIVFFLLFSIFLSFTACNSHAQYDLKADYSKYHSQNEREIFEISNELKVSIDYIHRSSEANPKVIVQLTSTTYWMFESPSGYSSTTEAYSSLFKWGKLNIEKKKSELRRLGEKFIEYAKSANLDNNYYLYVSLHTFCGEFIYDYECDKIWLPKQLDLQMIMYETFGTFKDTDLLNSSEGKSWLGKHNLARNVHGQIEINSNNFDYYNIYISDDGEFFTRNPQSSSLY